VQPDAWAPIYIDFKTLELVVTRTRRISDATGRPQGVVATDFSLKQLSAYLGTLSLSPNAVAVVAEHGGNLVAVSRGPHLKTVALGEHVRLNAAESGDPLVSGAFRAAQAMEAQRPVSGGQARSGSFRGEDGQVNQFGYARFTDSAGLDLLILVALPRADFLADVERNIVHTSLLAGLAALVAMGLGLALLAIVTRELRQFAAAARRVGEGVFEPLPQVARQDEIGELARSFSDMQHRLLTDQLTGLSNRHAILRRIEDRVLQQRRRGDEQPFVVMFVDFNRFKEINDRFGHAVGDLALTEMSQRLRQAVRVGDLVARYAGDEFVILLESVHNRGDAEAVRQHIEASLILPLNCLVNLMPPGEASAYGASCGLAVFPLDGQDTDSLLKHADADMYARKALSKSQRAADADKRPPPDAP
jgi:diguanylate cyclase (GGDEF)-like protein